MTYKLYQLDLAGGYIYVGISANPERRFNEHSTGTGAIICRKKKPIKIAHIMDTKTSSIELAKHIEDLNTLDLMCRYGTNAVYGGIYCHGQYREVLKSWLYEERIRVGMCVQKAAMRCGFNVWEPVSLLEYNKAGGIVVG